MVQPSTTRRRAFTLIELLVVISIIALLIGILLPALGAARKSAQSAGCLANIRSTSQAVNAYIADYQGIYPGPNTTNTALNARNYNLNVSSKRATKALQNFDWMSPTMGDYIGLPDDPTERLRVLFEQEFRCPSNAEFYPGGSVFGDLNPGPDLPVSSYSTPTPLHVWVDSPDWNVYIETRSFIQSVVECA